MSESFVSSADLAKSVGDLCGLPRPTVAKVLEGLDQVVLAELRAGKRVRVPGLGIATPGIKPAREGIYTVGSKRGQPFSQPARRAVKLRARPELRAPVDPE